MSPALFTLLTKEDMLCYCNDVSGLFEAIGVACNPDEWQSKQVSIPPLGSLSAPKGGLHCVKLLLRALKYVYNWGRGGVWGIQDVAF